MYLVSFGHWIDLFVFVYARVYVWWTTAIIKSRINLSFDSLPLYETDIIVDNANNIII